MKFDFGNANSAQKSAIQHTEGPLLLLAGPGTGKTYTLIKRVLFLIQTKSVKPENILLVTFTEKAAKEIITRLSNELLANNISLNLNEMYVGTIHSVCLRILKENLEHSSLQKNYQLFDQFDQQYFLYRNYWRHFLNIPDIELLFGSTSSIWDRVKLLQKYINQLSEELIEEADLVSKEDPLSKALFNVLLKYQELQKENNFLDFSSIQTMTYSLLSNETNGVLKKLHEKIQYIMVDEYQDTNYVQEQLLLLIASKNNHICVVGDDDQGLYRFRGATIRNILEFDSKFSDCEKIILNENYRSHNDIIDFYNNYMSESLAEEFNFSWGRYRFQKNIIGKKNSPSYSSVASVHGVDYNTLHSKILEQILSLKKNNVISDYNQIAFLFRSVKNKHVTDLYRFLEDNGVSVYSPRSDMFFERREIQLLLGGLMLMFPAFVSTLNSDENLWHQSINTYFKSCISLTLKEIKKHDDKLADFIKRRSLTHLTLPESGKRTDYAFTALVYQMLEYQLYSEIIDVDLRDGFKNSLPARNVSIFIHTLIKFEYLYNISVITSENIEKSTNLLFHEYLLFLFQGGISEYEDEVEFAPKGSVSFLTIHQSKGMEFPIVFVGSLANNPRLDNDKVIAHIEEELSPRSSFEPRNFVKYYDFWRLYYTAFSRAQNLLLLLGTDESRGVSKYFKTLYNALPDCEISYDFIAEKVNDANLKPSYSFTGDIQLYENCQVQYLFLRELKFEEVRLGSTIFGSLVHETIEDIHKAALRKEAHLINEETIGLWIQTNYETLSRKEKSYLQKKSIESAYHQVLNYFINRQSQWNSIVEAEVPVSLVKQDYILSGKIDLIQGDNDSYEIIDFKTEKKPDLVNDQVKLDTVRRQLEVYAHILEERFGYQISKLKVYYTSEIDGNPIIEFNKTHHSLNKTVEWFDQIAGNIDQKIFIEKAKDQRICNNCDMRYYCKTYQEKTT